MIEIIKADLNISEHAEAMMQLMETYAIDPMGGNKELSDHVKRNLVQELIKRTNSHIIIAFTNSQPAGLVICFEGFSTFNYKPLLNIHDLIVSPSHRRKGIARSLLQKVEAIAIELSCCKLTLEVLEGNTSAKSLYQSFGFEGYELNSQMGKALFWHKEL